MAAPYRQRVRTAPAPEPRAEPTTAERVWLAAASSPIRWLRRAAQRRLAAAARPAVVQHALDRVVEGPEVVRIRAWELLARVAQQAPEGLRREVRRSSSAELRAAARATVGTDDPAHVGVALSVLAVCGEREDGEHVVRFLSAMIAGTRTLRGRGDDVATQAVQALGELGYPLAVPLLVKAMGHPRYRRASAGALGDIGSPESAAALVAEIERCVEEPARAPGFLPRLVSALTTLARDTGAVDVPALLHHSHPALRMVGLDALAAARPEDLFEQLVPFLTDGEGSVRVRAAERLAELRDPRAVEPLCSCALSSDSWSQVAALVPLLRKLGDRRALGPIEALLARGMSDDDPDLTAYLRDLRQVLPAPQLNPGTMSERLERILIDAADTLRGT